MAGRNDLAVRKIVSPSGMTREILDALWPSMQVTAACGREAVAVENLG
jgi:hypothetical protein